MKEDFLAWHNEYKDLLSHLEENDSLLFNYLNDCLVVINYLLNQNEKKLTEEEFIALDVGFSYLHYKFGQLRIYLEKYFNEDLETFKKYDSLISYAFFLEDLKDTLLEQDELSEVIKLDLDRLENLVEDALLNKDNNIEEKLVEINSSLAKIIPSNKEFITIPELFYRIREDLDI